MKNTKEQILDIAEDLVQRVGVNAMSYKDISDAVGIRKPSIHHHFPKKENLVDELLIRCQNEYGNEYLNIVNDEGSAPDKLRRLAKVFETGLKSNKLCLVGSFSTDRNTLKESSCSLLSLTVQNTVSIFTEVFKQGKNEQSLQFSGQEEDVAYGFLSFLIGIQVVARSNNDCESFRNSVEAFISSWEV